MCLEPDLEHGGGLTSADVLRPPPEEAAPKPPPADAIGDPPEGLGTMEKAKWKRERRKELAVAGGWWTSAVAETKQA